MSEKEKQSQIKTKAKLVWNGHCVISPEELSLVVLFTTFTVIE